MRAGDEGAAAARAAAAAGRALLGDGGGGPGTHSGSAGGGWATLLVVAALLLGVPAAAIILYALWQRLSERLWRWQPAAREPLLPSSTPGGRLPSSTARPLAAAAVAEERAHVPLHAVEEHFSQRVRLAAAAEQRSAADARRGRPGHAARGPRAEPSLPAPPSPISGGGGGSGSPPPAGEEAAAAVGAERSKGALGGEVGGGFTSPPGAAPAAPPPLHDPFSFETLL
jgi:hypothetical protein